MPVWAQDACLPLVLPNKDQKAIQEVLQGVSKEETAPVVQMTEGNQSKADPEAGELVDLLFKSHQAHRSKGELNEQDTQRLNELREKFGKEAVDGAQLLLSHYERWASPENQSVSEYEKIPRYPGKLDVDLLKGLDLNPETETRDLRSILIEDILTVPEKREALKLTRSLFLGFYRAANEIFQADQQRIYDAVTKKPRVENGMIVEDPAFFPKLMQIAHFAQATAILMREQRGSQIRIALLQKLKTVDLTKNNWEEILEALDQATEVAMLRYQEKDDLAKYLQNPSEVRRDKMSAFTPEGSSIHDQVMAMTTQLGFRGLQSSATSPFETFNPDLYKLEVLSPAEIQRHNFLGYFKDLQGLDAEIVAKYQAKEATFASYMHELNEASKYNYSPAPGPIQIDSPEIRKALAASEKAKKEYEAVLAKWNSLTAELMSPDSNADAGKRILAEKIARLHENQKGDATLPLPIRQWLDSVQSTETLRKLIEASARSAEFEKWIKLNADRGEVPEAVKNYFVNLKGDTAKNQNLLAVRAYLYQGVNLPAQYEFLLKYSMDDLLRIHYLQSRFPSQSIGTPSKLFTMGELIDQVNQVLPYDLRMRQAFGGKPPKVAFSSPSNFDAESTAILVTLNECEKIAPGVDLQALGFGRRGVTYSKLPENRRLQAGDPAAFFAREAGLAVYELPKAQPQMQFSSPENFRKELQSFCADLKKKQEKLASEVSELWAEQIEGVVKSNPSLKETFEKYKTNFHSWTMPQLEAVRFLIDRYGLAEALFEPIEDPMALMVLKFDPRSPSQTRILLNLADQLAALEPVALSLYAENWKEVMGVSQNGQRPKPAALLISEGQMYGVMDQIFKYKAWTEKFGLGAAPTYDMPAPNIKWANEKTSEYRANLRRAQVIEDESASELERLDRLEELTALQRHKIRHHTFSQKQVDASYQVEMRSLRIGIELRRLSQILDADPTVQQALFEAAVGVSKEIEERNFDYPKLMDLISRLLAVKVAEAKGLPFSEKIHETDWYNEAKKLIVSLEDAKAKRNLLEFVDRFMKGGLTVRSDSLAEIPTSGADLPERLLSFARGPMMHEATVPGDVDKDARQQIQEAVMKWDQMEISFMDRSRLPEAQGVGLPPRKYDDREKAYGADILQETDQRLGGLLEARLRHLDDFYAQFFKIDDLRDWFLGDLQPDPKQKRGELDGYSLQALKFGRFPLDDRMVELLGSYELEHFRDLLSKSSATFFKDGANLIRTLSIQSQQRLMVNPTTLYLDREKIFRLVQLHRAGHLAGLLVDVRSLQELETDVSEDRVKEIFKQARMNLPLRDGKIPAELIYQMTCLRNFLVSSENLFPQGNGKLGQIGIAAYLSAPRMMNDLFHRNKESASEVFPFTVDREGLVKVRLNTISQLLQAPGKPFDADALSQLLVSEEAAGRLDISEFFRWVRTALASDQHGWGRSGTLGLALSGITNRTSAHLQSQESYRQFIRLIENSHSYLDQRKFRVGEREMLMNRIEHRGANSDAPGAFDLEAEAQLLLGALTRKPDPKKIVADILIDLEADLKNVLGAGQVTFDSAELAETLAQASERGDIDLNAFFKNVSDYLHVQALGKLDFNPENTAELFSFAEEKLGITKTEWDKLFENPESEQSQAQFAKLQQAMLAKSLESVDTSWNRMMKGRAVASNENIQKLKTLLRSPEVFLKSDLTSDQRFRWMTLGLFGQPLSGASKESIHLDLLQQDLEGVLSKLGAPLDPQLMSEIGYLQFTENFDLKTFMEGMATFVEAHAQKADLVQHQAAMNKLTNAVRMNSKAYQQLLQILNDQVKSKVFASSDQDVWLNSDFSHRYVDLLDLQPEQNHLLQDWLKKRLINHSPSSADKKNLHRYSSMVIEDMLFMPEGSDGKPARDANDAEIAAYKEAMERLNGFIWSSPSSSLRKGDLFFSDEELLLMELYGLTNVRDFLGKLDPETQKQIQSEVKSLVQLSKDLEKTFSSQKPALSRAQVLQLFANNMRIRAKNKKIGFEEFESKGELDPLIRAGTIDQGAVEKILAGKGYDGDVERLAKSEVVWEQLEMLRKIISSTEMALVHNQELSLKLSADSIQEAELPRLVESLKSMAEFGMTYDLTPETLIHGVEQINRHKIQVIASAGSDLMSAFQIQDGFLWSTIKQAPVSLVGLVSGGLGTAWGVVYHGGELLAYNVGRAALNEESFQRMALIMGGIDDGRFDDYVIGESWLNDFDYNWQQIRKKMATPRMHAPGFLDQIEDAAVHGFVPDALLNEKTLKSKYSYWPALVADGFVVVFPYGMGRIIPKLKPGVGSLGMPAELVAPGKYSVYNLGKKVDTFMRNRKNPAVVELWEFMNKERFVNGFITPRSNAVSNSVMQAVQKAEKMTLPRTPIFSRAFWRPMRQEAWLMTKRNFALESMALSLPQLALQRMYMPEGMGADAATMGRTFGDTLFGTFWFLMSMHYFHKIPGTRALSGMITAHILQGPVKSAGRLLEMEAHSDVKIELDVNGHPILTGKTPEETKLLQERYEYLSEQVNFWNGLIISAWMPLNNHLGKPFQGRAREAEQRRFERTAELEARKAEGKGGIFRNWDIRIKNYFDGMASRNMVQFYPAHPRVPAENTYDQLQEYIGTLRSNGASVKELEQIRDLMLNPQGGWLPWARKSPLEKALRAELKRAPSDAELMDVQKRVHETIDRVITGNLSRRINQGIVKDNTGGREGWTLAALLEARQPNFALLSRDRKLQAFEELGVSTDLLRLERHDPFEEIEHSLLNMGFMSSQTASRDLAGFRRAEELIAQTIGGGTPRNEKTELMLNQQLNRSARFRVSEHSSDGYILNKEGDVIGLMSKNANDRIEFSLNQMKLKIFSYEVAGKAMEDGSLVFDYPQLKVILRPDAKEDVEVEYQISNEAGDTNYVRLKGDAALKSLKEKSELGIHAEALGDQVKAPETWGQTTTGVIWKHPVFGDVTSVELTDGVVHTKIPNDGGELISLRLPTSENHLEYVTLPLPPENHGRDFGYDAQTGSFYFMDRNALRTDIDLKTGRVNIHDPEQARLGMGGSLKSYSLKEFLELKDKYYPSKAVPLGDALSFAVVNRNEQTLDTLNQASANPMAPIWDACKALNIGSPATLINMSKSKLEKYLETQRDRARKAVQNMPYKGTFTDISLREIDEARALLLMPQTIQTIRNVHQFERATGEVDPAMDYTMNPQSFDALRARR